MLNEQDILNRLAEIRTMMNNRTDYRFHRMTIDDDEVLWNDGNRWRKRKHEFVFDDNGLSEDWDNEELLSCLFDKAMTHSIEDVRISTEDPNRLDILVSQTLCETNITADVIESLSSLVWNKEDYGRYIEEGGT